MGSLSTGVGLISGINSSSIIDQLIALESRPKTLLQNRITVNNSIKVAYADLQARLSSLQSSANALVRPSTFQSAKATSSNESVLTANVSTGAQAGSYQFTVARTVASQSLISGGYASATTPIGAGTIHIGLGGGEVTSSADLADLNAGGGVRRGSFRITDKSGANVAIDISNAVSLDDVIAKINTADNISITASLGKHGLILTDTSSSAGTLKVTDLAGGFAAADLGIAGSSATTSLAGSDINKLGRNTALSSLNDGTGVRTKPGTDFTINLADGSGVGISLLGKRTLGDVIDTINNGSAGKVTASLRADGRGIQLLDNTSGGTELSVTPLSGSSAARDLGLTGAASGNTLIGETLRADLGSVLTRSLSGGSGLGTGTFDITDRAGNTASITLDDTTSSLSGLIESINNAGTGLKASINKAGTGITLTDSSPGSGQITIADTAGDVAAKLGIAGTAASGKTTVESGSLERQYISENSLLSSLNGGKGISAGKFKITNSAGVSADVDLSELKDAKLEDVISIINAKNIGITASVNADGNGLLLTDSANGAGKLTVADTQGTAAADLRIAGVADTTGNGTINGRNDATITLDATDTLDSLVKKISNARIGITASILNDGSPSNPYRLSLNASGSGQAGRFTFDAGDTSLAVDTLVKAQNAAVFLGSSTTSAPVLINSSSNTLTNILPGVSLNLASASSSPVTLTVTQNPDTAVSSIKSFVETLNGLTGKLKTLTSFDTTTNSKGLLLGDSTATSIVNTLFSALQKNIKGAGRYSSLSQIGITVGSNNTLSFSEDKFRAAYTADPQAATRLFTAFNSVATITTTDPAGVELSKDTVTTPFGADTAGTTTTTDGSGNNVKKVVETKGFGFAYAIQDAIKRLIDPTNGSIVLNNKAIDSANDNFQDRIKSLQGILDAKKLRLQKQFSTMEETLAKLQTQQSSLNQIQSLSYSSSR